MTFPSKRDWWVTILLSIAIGLMLFSAWSVLHGGPIERVVGPIVILVFVSGTLWLMFGTRYVLRGDTLLVYCGVLCQRIDVATITRVFPTDDPTSGPALSLDRVQIDYAKNGKPDTILVSPVDQAGFIAALKAANPRIDQGARLT